MTKEAFCLRCGNPLASHEEEGRTRMRCSACGWVHYGNPTPVVAAIVEHQLEGETSPCVVLVRNHGWPDKWFGLVTGFLEANESPTEGVLRELKQELGLDGTVAGDARPTQGDRRARTGAHRGPALGASLPRQSRWRAAEGGGREVTLGQAAGARSISPRSIAFDETNSAICAR